MTCSPGPFRLTLMIPLITACLALISASASGQAPLAAQWPAFTRYVDYDVTIVTVGPFYSHLTAADGERNPLRASSANLFGARLEWNHDRWSGRVESGRAFFTEAALQNAWVFGGAAGYALHVPSTLKLSRPHLFAQAGAGFSQLEASGNSWQRWDLPVSLVASLVITLPAQTNLEPWVAVRGQLRHSRLDTDGGGPAADDWIMGTGFGAGLRVTRGSLVVHPAIDLLWMRDPASERTERDLSLGLVLGYLFLKE
jgi:hypothetical protein